MWWWPIALAVPWVLLVLHDLLAIRRLRALPGLPAAEPAPEVTVVMAVRDDEAHVVESVTRLLQQRHVRLRVIAVDDRSRDGTATALARLAAAHDRLTIVTVRDLPPEWLGKSHALQQGAATVATRWILFTDGDAQMREDTLARAIAAAERDGAHHVSLLPSHRGTTFVGRACLLAFHLTILRRVAAVNATPQRSFVGTGAFNLVRTEAWRAIGGHLPLRLEVVDDVWLGCLLFRAGFRSRVWFAAQDLAIDWGGTPRQLLAVTTKNMFAVLRYRTVVAFGAVALFGLLVGISLAAPWLAGPLGWVPFAAWCGGALPGMAFARRMQWSVLAGALVPVTRFLLPAALLRSTWITLRQGGVRWRGTFYPLAMLRRGQVR